MKRDDQNCGNCYFSLLVDVNQYQCQESPPQAILVPVHSLDGQGVGLQSVSPPVLANGWCGRWKEKNSKPGLTVA